MPKSITETALFQRLKRKLEHDCEYLHKLRGGYMNGAYRELGDYYAVDERNHICRTYIDLEELGRELGVMRDDELLEH